MSVPLQKGAALRCQCGRDFYHDSELAGLPDGRLEALRADPDATGLPYSVWALGSEGKYYALDCECWTVTSKKEVAR